MAVGFLDFGYWNPVPKVVRKRKMGAQGTCRLDDLFFSPLGYEKVENNGCGDKTDVGLM